MRWRFAALTILLTLLPLLAALPARPQEAVDGGRGWLGLYIRDLDRQDIAALDLHGDTRGVVVSGVDDEGPAALAGIEPGDVITRLEGQGVDNRPGFLAALGNRRVGDRVRVKEGNFENQEGDVDTVDEANGRITVIINIFGRSVPMELDHWQVEPL